MFAVFVISLALLGLSGALIDSHRRTWRAARESEMSERLKRFAQAQYRRRMQASGMIGVIGAAICIWPLVPREPGPLAFYTATLLVGASWIMLLALLDVWATRQYYQRLRDEHLAAQLQLALEMKAAKRMTNDE